MWRPLNTYYYYYNPEGGVIFLGPLEFRALRLRSSNSGSRLGIRHRSRQQVPSRDTRHWQDPTQPGPILPIPRPTHLPTYQSNRKVGKQAGRFWWRSSSSPPFSFFFFPAFALSPKFRSREFRLQRIWCTPLTHRRRS